MKLTFIGAAHEVTGSCHLLQACGRNILIDCGMEQGPDLYENQELPVNAGDIDYVLLTHAHIDHSGKLPLLAKEGFRLNRNRKLPLCQRLKLNRRASLLKTTLTFTQRRLSVAWHVNSV